MGQAFTIVSKHILLNSNSQEFLPVFFEKVIVFIIIILNFGNVLFPHIFLVSLANICQFFFSSYQKTNLWLH